jgi:hypothetical protein
LAGTLNLIAVAPASSWNDARPTDRVPPKRPARLGGDERMVA